MWLTRIDLLHVTGRSAEALEVALQASRRLPNQASTWDASATQMEGVGRFEEALADLELAGKLALGERGSNPNLQARFHSQRARLLRGLGRETEAKEADSKAGLVAATLPQIDDWPAWGGNDPGRNMYSTATVVPDRFDAGRLIRGTEEVDLATTRNVRWVAKLGSQSHGSIAVSGGRIFVGTNNESLRDPRNKGDRSILLCLDEQDGHLLWQLVVPKLKTGKVNDWESLGFVSSPHVVGNRLYVVTTRAEVLCLDVQGMADGNDGPFVD